MVVLHKGLIANDVCITHEGGNEGDTVVVHGSRVMETLLLLLPQSPQSRNLPTRTIEFFMMRCLFSSFQGGTFRIYQFCFAS